MFGVETNLVQCIVHGEQVILRRLKLVTEAAFSAVKYDQLNGTVPIFLFLSSTSFLLSILPLCFCLFVSFPFVLYNFLCPHLLMSPCISTSFQLSLFLYFCLSFCLICVFHPSCFSLSSISFFFVSVLHISLPLGMSPKNFLETFLPFSVILFQIIIFLFWTAINVIYLTIFSSPNFFIWPIGQTPY